MIRLDPVGVVWVFDVHVLFKKMQTRKAGGLLCHDVHMLNGIL